MGKEIEIAEKDVNKVNNNFFLREFTFAGNKLKTDDKQEIQLADNIVWLDEILFLIEVKWRNPENAGNEDEEIKWYENKVLRKSKNQIKKTIKYFKDITNLEIENGRGFKVNLSDAPILKAKKIIIYQPSERLPVKERLVKFYNSKDVELIHLFNFVDYNWICKYLITPTEISNYLNFREHAYRFFGDEINLISEQLLLGKFLSGEEILEINSKYIDFFYQFERNADEFDVSLFLETFHSTIVKEELDSSYFPIVKEIAKLSRFQLKEFKQRLILSIEDSKSRGLVKPYRIAFPSNDIGFVFVPIPFGNEKFLRNWKIDLESLTSLHKYDQKVKRCIGISVFRLKESSEFIEMPFCFIESDWKEDKFLEKILKESFPFRKVKEVIIGKYKFHEK